VAYWSDTAAINSVDNAMGKVSTADTQNDDIRQTLCLSIGNSLYFFDRYSPYLLLVLDNSCSPKELRIGAAG
jgi:hypothetical protein